jgi:hypothetical protein
MKCAIGRECLYSTELAGAKSENLCDRDIAFAAAYFLAAGFLPVKIERSTESASAW